MLELQTLDLMLLIGLGVVGSVSFLLLRRAKKH